MLLANLFSVDRRRVRGEAGDSRLSPARLISPILIVDEDCSAQKFGTTFGAQCVSPHGAAEVAARLSGLGIPAVLLFGIVSSALKNPEASYSVDPASSIVRAIKSIKDRVPNMYVMTDLCVCEYTPHGHCILGRREDAPSPADYDLARTQNVLVEQAILHVEAGADCVSPSGMIQGAVRIVRIALDQHGATKVAVVSQTAKLSSSLYAPFRSTAGMGRGAADKRWYQVGIANGREALAEIREAVAERVDGVMIKPAMTSLDLISRASRSTPLPVFAFQASGELALLQGGASIGAFDFARAATESLAACFRAGASGVVTYFAEEFARTW